MQIPYEVTPRRDTGLFNAKLGIWLFLASEVMLFGGLFSAYVFLRVGVREGIDAPWPNGTDVHGYSFASGEFGVWIGFLNTLILIASSVFVVMAWAALKMGNWRKYQGFMLLVLLCAALFMVNKGYEYYQKFHHFGARLTDGTLVDGKLAFDAEHGHNGEKISFEVKQMEFGMNLREVSAYFFKFAQIPKDAEIGVKLETWKLFEKRNASDVEKDPAKKLADLSDVELAELGWVEVKISDDWWASQEIPDGNLDAWFAKHKLAWVRNSDENATPWDEVEDRLIEMKEGQDELRDFVIEERREVVQRALDAYRDSLDQLQKKDRTVDWKFDKRDWDNRVRRAVAGVTVPGLPYVLGKLEKKVLFELSASDILNRDYSPREDDSDLEIKHRAPLFRGCAIIGEVTDDLVDIEVHTLDFQMTRDDGQSLAWELLGEEGAAYKAGYREFQSGQREEFADWVKKGGTIPNDKMRLWMHIHPGHHKDETGGEGQGDHHEYPIVSIPRDQIRFMSNHGPAFHPYNAIYFTMTGLHGLHVICGAVVLGHFLFFGKKLYDKNPEHLANRVEVGGLFWHFVDLVWIFLFPIMYLL
ncbi:MAG: heme/copper-type cytochrome/quinol oxidase subunit 3 [Verrucomicrobiales bacterium]|jgi:heme/copper-type cytochrome/quinol oxidase subunit 3